AARKDWDVYTLLGMARARSNGTATLAASSSTAECGDRLALMAGSSSTCPSRRSPPSSKQRTARLWAEAKQAQQLPGPDRIPPCPSPSQTSPRPQAAAGRLQSRTADGRQERRVDDPSGTQPCNQQMSTEELHP